MPRRLRVNTAQTSNSELVSIAKRSGFVVFNGAKHDKIKTGDGKFITMIPRSNKLSKHLVKRVIEAMNAYGASITFT